VRRERILLGTTCDPVREETFRLIIEIFLVVVFMCSMYFMDWFIFVNSVTYGKELSWIGTERCTCFSLSLSVASTGGSGDFEDVYY
jgi:hypothetical protein